MINTGTGATPPTLTEPLAGGGTTTLNGTVFSNAPGNQVAVFDFASLSIGTGMSFSITGALPLVLLSHGDVTISGTGKLDVSGGPGGGVAAVSAAAQPAAPVAPADYGWHRRQRAVA